MTKDNVIGLNGSIPWHYSSDLKRFKQRTMGANIVMGRLTWKSIGCGPLPGRRNIVISRSPVDGVECYTDINMALSQCHNKDTWIIGGRQIYLATFDWITLLDVTYVPDRVESEFAVRFPEIKKSNWRISARTRLENPNLKNIIYHRKKPTFPDRLT